jgi:hypothetical protein
MIITLIDDHVLHYALIKFLGTSTYTYVDASMMEGAHASEDTKFARRDDSLTRDHILGK